MNYLSRFSSVHPERVYAVPISALVRVLGLTREMHNIVVLSCSCARSIRAVLKWRATVRTVFMLPNHAFHNVGMWLPDEFLQPTVVEVDVAVCERECRTIL